MSSYTSYDFSESLGDILVTDIKHVAGAWGYSPDGWGSWSGGFLCEMRDGRWLYITGWCDTSGWGCQQGRKEVWFATKPDVALLPEWPADDGENPPDPNLWDLNPTDLNRYVAGEIGSFTVDDTPPPPKLVRRRMIGGPYDRQVHSFYAHTITFSVTNRTDSTYRRKGGINSRLMVWVPQQ